MAESAVSRRLSEFTGVALFAGALLWLIALVSYTPDDPAWFFNSVTAGDAAELRRPRRRVHRGGVVPAARLRRVPHSARRSAWSPGITSGAGRSRAGYTKLVGAGLLVGSVSALLSLAFGAFDTSTRHFHAGGVIGEALAAAFSIYLNRTGAAILLLTLLVFAVILSTQFSFGLAFSGVAARLRSQARARRPLSRVARRAAARQRAAADRRETRQEGRPRACAGDRDQGRRCRREAEGRAREGGARVGRRRRRRRRRAAARSRRKPRRFAAAATVPSRVPLPLARQRRAEDAGRAPQGRLRAAAGHAARRAEGPAEDRRARPDGRRAAARREVPRVLRGRLGRADPSGPGRHDLRVQAGRRREVQPHHRPRRRSVPGDAGRVGPDRSHSRQVHRRHPDSESASRDDHAARAARVRDLHALDVAPDDGARQDDSRRAVRQRPGDDAASAHRRIDRRRQVGQRERA